MSRPADTANIGKYLWWLLPRSMKRKERSNSLTAAILAVFGDELEQARSALAEIPYQALIATATGAFLKALAADRQIYPAAGESEDSLRTRALAAFLSKQADGTIAGMTAALSALGYTVEIAEPFKGTGKWSHFIVTVTAWDGAVSDQKLFFQTVRAMKPAHTRALIDSRLTPGKWDDGGDFDGFGETLDDWIYES